MLKRLDDIPIPMIICNEYGMILERNSIYEKNFDKTMINLNQLFYNQKIIEMIKSKSTIENNKIKQKNTNNHQYIDLSIVKSENATFILFLWNSGVSINLASKFNNNLRTPLTGIIGMIVLLIKTDMTPIQIEYVNILKESAFSLLKNLNDYTDYINLQLHNVKLDNNFFETKKCINDVVETFEILSTSNSTKKKILVVIDIATDVPTCLIGDSVQLSHIFLHLIDNSVKSIISKYTSNNIEKGQIMISLKSELLNNVDGIKLICNVSDNGIGIDINHQTKLFNEDTNSNFGLLICKKICKLMSGNIWLENSMPNIGTTFIFTLVFQQLI
jgi:signal transduction histidine kinase